MLAIYLSLGSLFGPRFKAWVSGNSSANEVTPMPERRFIPGRLSKVESAVARAVPARVHATEASGAS